MNPNEKPERINCSIYDELEIVAMRGETVRLQYMLDGKLTNLETKLRDFKVEAGREFGFTSDGHKIPLDQIIFSNNVHIHNPFRKQIKALSALLEQHAYAPILAQGLLTDENAVAINLSSTNEALNDISFSDQASFTTWIENQCTNHKIGFGGYGEDREVYRRSTTFGAADEARTVHLGVDLWAHAGASISAPLDGIVHSKQNNTGEANYGPTIILEHTLEEHTFYTLYGHLGSSVLDHVSVGQKITAGESFATIGSWAENGHWPPHLHFQIITDLMGASGDFPGVAKASEAGFYLSLCLNPDVMLQQTTK